jgi:CTP synthase
MRRDKKIIIIGDFNENYFGHKRIYEVLNNIPQISSGKIAIKWINTDQIKYSLDEIINSRGIWFALGSPYLEGSDVINTIKVARENKILTLGTCGGFQYMLIEYALNVLNIKQANSEELDPNCNSMIIKKLKSSLVGLTEELSFSSKNSIFNNIYCKSIITEKYDCNYGFNRDFSDCFNSDIFSFTILNKNNEPRGFELKDHPFYVGVLFIPQINLTDEPHPLIKYFIDKCCTK